jgi:serine/threonine protein kinase
VKKFYREFRISDKIAGRFEILKILKGGIGLVYICVDHVERQIIALKTFQAQYFFDEIQIKKFNDEALLWISLPWHINIVKALGIVSDTDLPFICLEYIHSTEEIGHNLRDYLYSNILTFRDKLELSIQLCTGMDFISRELSFIHRDLKPENLLITPDKILKITDFGLSKMKDLGSSNQQTDFKLSARAGTYLYMSPEQLTRNTIDYRSDIFSAGIILYELFSSRHPFSNSVNMESATAAIIKHNPVEVKEIETAIPDELNYLITKCLEKNPNERWNSFSEIKENLLSIYVNNFGTEFEFEEHNVTDESYRKLFSKASSLLELGYLDEAEKLFLNTILQFPNGWESLHLLSLLYQKQKKFEKSKIYFLKALEINNSDPRIWNNYGITLCEMGDLIESRNAFKKALSLNSKHFKAYTNLASVYDEEKDFEKAVEYCEKAISINPNSDRAWYNRAYYSSIIFDYAKAIESANRTIELNPNYAKAYWIKSLSCYYLFREDEAKEAIQIALNLDPQNGEFQKWYNRLIN